MTTYVKFTIVQHVSCDSWQASSSGLISFGVKSHGAYTLPQLLDRASFRSRKSTISSNVLMLVACNRITCNVYRGISREYNLYCSLCTKPGYTLVLVCLNRWNNWKLSAHCWRGRGGWWTVFEVRRCYPTGSVGSIPGRDFFFIFFYINFFKIQAL